MDLQEKYMAEETERGTAHTLSLVHTRNVQVDCLSLATPCLVFTPHPT